MREQSQEKMYSKKKSWRRWVVLLVLLLLLVVVWRSGGYLSSHSMQQVASSAYASVPFNNYLQRMHTEQYQAPSSLIPTFITGLQRELALEVNLPEEVLHSSALPATVRRIIGHRVPQRSLQRVTHAAVDPVSEIDTQRQMSAALVALEGLMRGYLTEIEEDDDPCQGIDLSILKFSNCIAPFDEGGYAYGAGGSGGGSAPAAPAANPPPANPPAANPPPAGGAGPGGGAPPGGGPN